MCVCKLNFCRIIFPLFSNEILSRDCYMSLFLRLRNFGGHGVRFDLCQTITFQKKERKKEF